MATVVALIGALMIVSTYETFSNTYDEPAHLAAGMEWLSRGAYTYEAQHPPLGRIAAAIGPYLYGDRSIGDPSIFREGAKLLGRGDHYRTSLALARLGELPFFLLICGVVWAWGRRLADERGGAIAVLLVATNPNLLAHAGLATTDIGLTATLAAALLAFVVWLETPTWKISALLGAAFALTATSKFSSLAFLAPALVAILLARHYAVRDRERRSRPSAASIAITLLAASILVWAVYRFNVGPLTEGGYVVPAPAFFRGISTFISHGSGGHPAFLLGELSMTGWWYYFPVALLVKTPLPLLLFSLLGAAVAIRDLRTRRDWSGAALVAGVVSILVVAAASKVDIGIRLVLPVYPLLAVLGASGAVELWERGATTLRQRRSAQATVAAGLAASIFIAGAAHPDHLAYFNPLAGENPEGVLVDSNLDWGQDLYRLGDTVRRMRIDSLRIAYFGYANFAAAGVPNAKILFTTERPTGWIAASQTMLAGVWVGSGYAWLRNYEPVGRVGSSLLLYYIPSAEASREGSGGVSFSACQRSEPTVDESRSSLGCAPHSRKPGRR